MQPDTVARLSLARSGLAGTLAIPGLLAAALLTSSPISVMPFGGTGLALIFAGLLPWLWLQLDRNRTRQRHDEITRLRNELAIHRAAIEHSPMAILLTGADASIRYVNPALMRITGFTEHELLGRYPTLFLPEDAPEDIVAELRRSMQQGQPWSGELHTLRKSGDLIWEQANIIPVHGVDGRVAAYVGLKLDLSARKAAEQRVNETEERLRAILANLPCVVYQVQTDPGGHLRFNYISERVDIYGLTVEQIRADPDILFKRIHPDDRQRVAAESRRVAEHLQPHCTRYRMHHYTDGREIWVESRVVPRRLADGSIVSAGYSMDITAQRHVEEQLRASEQKFRTLIESANDIIYTLEATGRVDYVSPNWTEILGHPTASIVGQRFEELLHPDDRASVRELLAATLINGNKQEGIEYRIRRLDGSWIWHTANGAPLHAPDGSPSGMIGIARDISERKIGEARILRMAHYDALTDLPNRSLFFDRLQQALQLASRHERSLALLFIDLDRFKPINDMHGHGVGDFVLQTAARRMSDTLRGSDAVGRIGGDEFVVLLSEIEDTATALEVATKICNAISEPVVMDDLQLQISCCVGVAVYPEHGSDAAELFRNADLAMYRAKDAGRDGIRVYRADEILATKMSEQDDHGVQEHPGVLRAQRTMDR